MAKIVVQKTPDARAYITLSEAITAAGVAGGTVHIVEPVTLDQNTTVSGCTIKVTEPGYINLGNYNLTFDSTSRVECPYNYQAFYYTGSGVVTFASESVPYVAVKWLPDFSKAVAAGSTILLSSSVTLTANYSGGTNKHLIILKGGSIVSATYAFEWTGTLDAGNYQIFSGFGAGNLTLNIEYVYPQWIGTTISTAVSALGISETTLRVNTSINVSSIVEAVTIPVNISVNPIKSGIVDIGSATGLNIIGPVVGNPMHQWLSGFSAGEVTLGLGSVDKVYPDWFQINTTPGTTDMTVGLKTAYAAASSCKGQFTIPPKTYRFTSEFPFDGTCDVIGIEKQTSVLKKDGNFIGIKIGSVVHASGQEQRYHNFTIDGAAGNGNVGIEVWTGSRINMDSVNVINQGSHGLHIRSGNIGSYSNISTSYNGGDGTRVEGGTGYDSGSANANSFWNIDTIGNDGIGFNVVYGGSNCSSNFGFGVVAQQNTGGGVLMSGVANSIHCYTETNGGLDFEFDADSVRCFAFINHIGNYLTAYSDSGLNNVLIDVGAGFYFKAPSISAAQKNTNAVGRNFNVIGGAAGAGATAYAGGDVEIKGGDAAGTAGSVYGGAVKINSGVSVNRGPGFVYLQPDSGNIVLGKEGKVISAILHGKVTLAANAGVTGVSLTGVLADSRIILTPTSATAGADVGSTTGVYVVSIAAGSSFTIAHPNTADTAKTFDFIVINPEI